MYLGQVGNLGSRDERVKLCANGGGYILTVDGDRLPLLEYFAETFGKRLRSFSNHLTAENIAYRVLDDLRLFFTVIAVQLAKILKAETDRYLVASGGSDEVVQSTE